jgi:hypothetical protein
MSTLAEIISAAERLPVAQQQELFLHLAEKLRAQGTPLPGPRTFSREQIDKWLEQDEHDMADLREME